VREILKAAAIITKKAFRGEISFTSFT
jgi:hypothetical protein